MEIVLVGLNYRTAPVEVRERASFSGDQAQRAAEELRAQGFWKRRWCFRRATAAKCMALTPMGIASPRGRYRLFLSNFHEVLPDQLDPSLYHHYDHDAVRHLFRVSAGLESMLLGEAEILGQVREAYLMAHETHVTGPVLNRLFQAALEIGKRVRAETELGTRPMGVAFGRNEAGGADFREAEGAQRAGAGRGNDQRAGGFATAGPQDRTSLCDEPFAG